MNTRRRLVIALCASAFQASLGSFAQQQGKVWRIGMLWERAQSDYSPSLEAFKGGMRGLGYAEGKDYAIEQRSAQNDLAHLPALMAELLALKVNLIMVSGTPSAIAANNATRDLPILIVTVSDPIVIGLARSFSRPGGNVTRAHSRRRSRPRQQAFGFADRNCAWDASCRFSLQSRKPHKPANSPAI